MHVTTDIFGFRFHLYAQLQISLLKQTRYCKVKTMTQT